MSGLSEDRIRKELNPAQAEAVLVCDRPQLILAGAGSGKTRVLTWKIAWLVGALGRAPWEIVALTFTNKAAREMRERAEKLCGHAAPEWMGTFHSLCARMLRRDGGLLGYGPSFSIYDTDDQKKVFSSLAEEMGLGKRDIAPEAIRRLVSSAKNRGDLPEELERTAQTRQDELVARAYRKYQDKLRSLDAMDFDDLLLNALELLRRHPEREDWWQRRFGYVMVDEYQDTNNVQYQLVRRLASHGRLMVVGDDDQSIYSWRGADIRNILDFERDFPGAHVVKLEQNYRSTANILKAAGSVIANNRGRKAKELWTDSAPGEKISVWQEQDDLAEARQCARILREALRTGRTTALFYRTNAQSRVLEEALRREGIRYAIIGGIRFYERAEIKDALSWLRLLVNPRDLLALERAVTAPRRGVGEKTLSAYALAAAEKHSGDLVATLLGPAPEGVGKATAEKAGQVGKMLAEWKQAMEAGLAIDDLCARVLEESGLAESISAIGGEEAKERLRNLEELVSACREYRDRNPDRDLAGFLEEVSLISDIDQAETEEGFAVLMTLHNSKGLEFDEVCIAGCEEGLFPLMRSDAGEEGLEEERRLFYVGATRARRKLHLLHARSRRRYGTLDPAMPSRFLDELDATVVDSHAVAPQMTWQGGGQRMPWGGAGPRRFSSLPREGDEEAGVRGDGAGRGRGEAWGKASRSVGHERLDEELQEMPNYEDASQEGEGIQLKPGMRVRHPRFGKGLVVGVSGTGSAARIDVLFENRERKRLVAGFAGLTLL